MRGLVVALCLVASTARAEPPALTAPVAHDEPVATTSYRTQIVASDVVAVAGFLILRNTNDPDPTLAKLDVALYMVGAPFIHAKHQRGYRMLASVALRAGLPLAVGGIGEAIDDCSHCEPGQSNFAYGLLAGALAAMVIDASLIAKPLPVEPTGVMPAVTATRGGAAFGVAGWF